MLLLRSTGLKLVEANQFGKSYQVQKIIPRLATKVSCSCMVSLG